MKPGTLGNRTGSGTSGMEYAVRESAAQIEDLRMKLKMVRSAIQFCRKSTRLVWQYSPY